ncbi:hypothetical protein XENOCAPTIV_009539 [Xenoophorus captivus]|uniref:Uncharacterized protein n=1 Tax=Xenoophorus captivus TaxID=1517983 RepID=A0ABV0RC52_9TELE
MGCCQEEDERHQNQQCREAEGQYQSNLGFLNTSAEPQTDLLHAQNDELLSPEQSHDQHSRRCVGNVSSTEKLRSSSLDTLRCRKLLLRTSKLEEQFKPTASAAEKEIQEVHQAPGLCCHHCIACSALAAGGCE